MDQPAPAYATIVLEDHDGAIACKLTFSGPTGGFDPSSHAHQHAQILFGMMDQLCTNKGPLPDAAIQAPQPTLIVGPNG